MKHPLLAAILLSLAACGADSSDEDNTGMDAQAEMIVPSGAAPEPPVADLGVPNAQVVSDNPMAAQLAEVGGSVAAAVDLCGLDVEPAEFADSKRQQQEHFIQMGGGTREQFETAYQAGHDQATARYEAGDAAQRQALCDELKQLEMVGGGAQP